MSNRITQILLVSLLLLLSGCGSLVHHKVQQGDTLYSISWRYGYDVKEVAAWNDLKRPYVIHEGQMLRISPPLDKSSPAILESARSDPPKVRESSSSATVAKAEPRSSSVQKKSEPLTWRWPADGKLLRTFSSKKIDRKGVDIAGDKGAPVRAAANGRVVYSGNGLTHYGNLVIIKHNEQFLSAYAHNDKLLVKEGASVKRGQKIAAMGATGADRVMLHFEIRRNGKPVDPQQYLPKRR